MRSYILLLLVALYASMASGDDSIDCGSPGLFSTNIVWSGDQIYINNGDCERVQSRYSISEVLDTLRVFKTRKKNCYAVSVTQGSRILLRASFLYGNYDGKSSPPSFALQFDANNWVNVETSMDQVIYHELIYTAKGDYSSICVAQTNPNQFPFISAVEFHIFQPGMYKYSDAYALYLKSRVAYGVDKETGLYDDPFSYRRVWAPAEGKDGLNNVTSDAYHVIDTLRGNYLPQSVLQNAVTPSDESLSIKLVTTFPSVEVPIYMNLYFCEVNSTETRSFILYKDDDKFGFLDPIKPPYDTFLEVPVHNVTVDSTTTFSLVATPGSTIPPIINAMEVFFISDVLTDGTNTKDVEGLVLLRNTFAVLQDWRGDPCLPAPYSWDWINCSSDPIPRVTALNLRSFDLSGELPDFSSMDALQIIDLKNNSLSGEIPDFLGKLSNLKILNLADNQFSGHIPSSLSSNNDLKLDVTGNLEMCTTSEPCQTTDSPYFPNSSGTSFGSSKKKNNKLPVILGTTIPSFFLIWVIIAVFVVIPYYKKRAGMAAANAGQHGGGNPPHGTAVNSFMNEIGNNINEQVGTELVGQLHSQQTTGS